MSRRPIQIHNILSNPVNLVYFRRFRCASLRANSL
jgi:hypothetical protein